MHVPGVPERADVVGQLRIAGDNEVAEVVLLRERGLKCEYYDYFYIKKQNGGPLRLGLRGNANSSVAVPVGECLGDDPSNWYRAGR